VCLPWGGAAPDGDRADVVVTDLGTRHLPAGEARRRAGTADAIAPGRAAHKIDSTLRGNWADELAARLATHPRVAVVAAFPAAGRTCVGGVVREHGIPVAAATGGRDARRPIASSRPADLLDAAGVADVAHAADAAALAAWLRGDARRAVVVDAASDADLAVSAGLLAAAPDALVAGTAAALAALARTMAGPIARPGTGRCAPVGTPAIVVCGSRHPAAREQLRRLRARLGSPSGACAIAVVAPDDDRPGDPATVLRDLSARAAAARANLRPRTLIVLGGDTAAAVLGDVAMVVEGSHGVGVARCRSVDDPDLVVLARPGGFGGPDALVELVGST
jgi:4-hydroxythreonine-4-phosphate dehydrogenase